ncbi:hypothetical protein BDC45DRAFT_33768 [Circinella umbellata]|nr:hypothetical protein BDC45DRAFT_33768 [Circinella umbellata]
MSQPTKESIQQRLAILKKQAGFAFHNDLFISILLCLISGRDKHLILTAAPHRLPEVSQMATLICRCLFGFSTANVICHQNQNPSDLVHSLFAATRDEYTESTEHRNSSHKLFGDSLHPPSDSVSRHRSAQSMQALDSRPSLLSYPSFKTMGNRNHLIINCISMKRIIVAFTQSVLLISMYQPDDDLLLKIYAIPIYLLIEEIP